MRELQNTKMTKMQKMTNKKITTVTKMPKMQKKKVPKITKMQKMPKIEITNDKNANNYK